MYQVLLVDDEPIVKVALRTIVNWESLGFSICATASDGVEALQFIEKYQPDIIITDLKMPQMDGLQLIRNLKEKEYPGKIIVASNFGEYELVREALTLGAMDYILKISINAADLTALIQKAVSQLETERHTQKQQKNQIQLLEHNLKQIKSAILKDYLLDPNLREEFLLENDSVDFPQLPESYMCLLTIKSAREQHTFTFPAIEGLLREALKSIETIEILPIDSTNVLLIFMKEELDRKKIHLKDLIHKVEDSLKTYTCTNPNIIYTPAFKGYSQAKEQFQQCQEASEIIFYDYQNMICTENIKLQHHIKGKTYQEFACHLVEKLEKKDLEGSLQKLKEFLEDCRSHQIHPEILKLFLQKVLDYIPICSSFLHIENTETYDANREQISSCLDCKQLMDVFEISMNLLINDNSLQCSGMRKEILAVIKFINQNYTEKISLIDISRQVNLNENYLCRVFKEQTGKSIVNYLNEVRMKHAASLLLDGNVYMKEIAAAVGIDDPFYFTRLFKKYYNVNPSEYKISQTKLT